MNSTILVMTTVHWPDDTRIRERLIRTLGKEFPVVYAARSPGPSDTDGLEYVELTGGRLRRNLGAIRLSLTARFGVLVIHDPELVPGGLLVRLLRRRPVVFDVHEDVPATAYTRGWVPRLARRPLSALTATLLRVAERSLTITLAEPGYQRLFRRSHPIFANYPSTSGFPEPGGDPTGPAIYLGDVTRERGADVAVAACSALGVPLRLIGRVTEGTRATLLRESTLGDDLSVEGLVPNPTALGYLAVASVGLAPLRDLPNYRHSQPTKILEYLAMGLPVVASDLPGTRELVEGLDAVTLVKPGDADDLSTAIAEARSPDVARRARAQASDIRSRFRWPADEVRDFYRTLV
ncbi:MAG TPA: glycosyltransferase [Acidimicrobiia bacterium]|nr:glycosyltransferase [Acidimicrobiia bacterium]